MKQPTTPDYEDNRLLALDAYKILDSLPEKPYNDIARLAAKICNVEKAMIAFIDKTRKWHKANYNLEISEVPREASICSRTIQTNKPLIFDDTLNDPEVSSLDMVTKPPNVRFYAGIPLMDDEGYALGTICVIDTIPRKLSSSQIESLSALSRQVMQLLRLRKEVLESKQKELELIKYQKKLNMLNQELQTLSLTDHLTGLNNRRAFDDTLALEISRASRNNGSLSLLVIDIDHFKQFNDRFGHSEGDKILQMVGETLKNSSRNYDFAARYGGEEFTVILPNTSVDRARQVAENLRRSIQNIKLSSESISVSIGVAEYTSETDPTSFFNKADKALLIAKNSGRNCVK